jgi:hypothetical protein
VGVTPATILAIVIRALGDPNCNYRGDWFNFWGPTGARQFGNFQYSLVAHQVSRGEDSPRIFCRDSRNRCRTFGGISGAWTQRNNYSSSKRTTHHRRPSTRRKISAPPSLVFGFFTLDTSVFPLVRQSIPVVNDIVSVDFFARNMSEGISATFGEIWVRIPDDGGRYAEEPEGFHRVSGAFERERSTNFDILYAHSFLRKMTVKFFVPRNWQFLTLGLKYACQNCGAVDNWQTLTVDLVRASGKDNVATRKGFCRSREIPVSERPEYFSKFQIAL